MRERRALLPPRAAPVAAAPTGSATMTQGAAATAGDGVTCGTPVTREGCGHATPRWIGIGLFHLEARARCGAPPRVRCTSAPPAVPAATES
eukprot:13243258-Alexandrium_andersonii.AAC.1